MVTSGGTALSWAGAAGVPAGGFRPVPPFRCPMLFRDLYPLLLELDFNMSFVLPVVGLPAFHLGGAISLILPSVILSRLQSSCVFMMLPLGLFCPRVGLVGAFRCRQLSRLSGSIRAVSYWEGRASPSGSPLVPQKIEWLYRHLQIRISTIIATTRVQRVDIMIS